jgi:hypothetical protein
MQTSNDQCTMVGVKVGGAQDSMRLKAVIMAPNVSAILLLSLVRSQLNQNRGSKSWGCKISYPSGDVGVRGWYGTQLVYFAFPLGSPLPSWHIHIT